MTNIVTAIFDGGWTTTTDPLHQYDYGQILRFSGIDDITNGEEEYEVHFSNNGLSGSAKSVTGSSSGVIIPDEYLTSGADIHAWVFVHTGESDQDEEYTDGKTAYEVIIPVIKRARPSNIAPTPVKHGTISEEIEDLQDAVNGLRTDVDTIYPAARKFSAMQSGAVQANVGFYVPAYGITVGSETRDSGAPVSVVSSQRAGRLLASYPDGNLGLYDVTNGNWVLVSGADQGVRTDHPLLARNFDTTSRYLVQSGNLEAHRTKFIATYANSISVSGEWGGNIFDTDTISTDGSDARMKDNIQDCSKSGLDAINALRVRQFDWKNDRPHWDFGLVAQEVLEIDPNAVVGTDETMYGINTLYLVDMLIKSVQELSARIEELEGQNT